MLPPFDLSGNLPPGIHFAEWSEIVERFGVSPHRRRLLGGLERALSNLRSAGCLEVYLDGSFVTSADHPNDFDACWDATGVDLAKVDPVLKTFAHKRALQKAKYYGELFPAHLSADGIGTVFLDFFQIDKLTGNAKGIVGVKLQGFPL